MNFRVTCWVKPQSEVELVNNNNAKEFILQLCELIPGLTLAERHHARQVFENPEKGLDHMVLKDFRIQLDHDIDDVKTELMPIIFKDYPEAKLSSWDRV